MLKSDRFGMEIKGEKKRLKIWRVKVKIRPFRYGNR